MRAVVQRVSKAEVNIDNQKKESIDIGFVVLVGITHHDTQIDVEWLAKKIVNMRVFGDDQGLMNRSILDIKGEILVISQFTLFASTKKGNRPSFINAAKPNTAEKMYESFLVELNKYIDRIKCGVFGANMQVTLVNDGPVTILIDSKRKE